MDCCLCAYARFMQSECPVGEPDHRRRAGDAGDDLVGPHVRAHCPVVSAHLRGRPSRVSLILVCENNQYATSLPIERAGSGLHYRRVAGFGIPGGRNPGMDPVVVFRATPGCCGTGAR